MSLHWQAWRDRDLDPWVVEVLRRGYLIPFARVPPLSQEPIPMPSYAPMSTKGVAQEDTRALISKGAIELAPLPSPGFYSRLFVVWKTSGSWRPVIDLSQPLSHFLSFQDGDHPVCSSLGSSGGLDGVHRFEGSLLADSGSSRLSQVSEVCCVWPSLSIPSSLFRPRLGPSGLHTSYGSSFVNFAFHGYSFSSLSGRLVDPFLFSGRSLSRSSGGPRSLQGIRDCGESREVQFCSIPAGPLCGDSSGRPVYSGFSVPGSDRQAAISRRRISVLRSIARRLLAVSPRHSVLSHPSCTRRQTSHEVASVPTPTELGSGGGFHSDSLDSRLLPRPPLVVRRAWSPSRGVSRPGLLGPHFLVRRLGHGLGS